MREIKFRVFFYDGIDYSKGVMMSGLEAWSENYIDWDENDCLAPTDECSILMQYTGLKDKNGVEVYEGDLLMLYNNKNGFATVEFKNCYNGGWVLTHKDADRHISLGAREVDELEVIGNIYENPELLEK